MDLIIKILLVSWFLFTVSGCATSQKIDAGTGKENSGNSNTDIQMKFLDVLQFTTIKEIKEKTPSTIPMNGLYTRIKILPILSQNDCVNSNCTIIPYPYKQRNWLSRFFVDNKMSINASIMFSAGNYKSTIPLTSIENISTWSEGNSWLRNITFSNTHEPLFLVPNGIASASTTFRLQSIEENAPQSGAILDLAVNAIGLVAPTAGILTSINENDFKAKAAAIDSTLKGVFSKNLTEDVTFSINLSNWSDERKYRASLVLPYQGEDWDSVNKGIVGVWEISAEAPKPSIFYDIHVCPEDKPTGKTCKSTVDAAVSEVFTNFKKAPKYAEVLGKSLGSKSTDKFTSIQSIIIQLPEVVKLQSSDYASNLSAIQLANVNAACASIQNQINLLGLSQFDSQLVIWSAFNGIPSIPLQPSEIIKHQATLKSCQMTITNLT